MQWLKHAFAVEDENSPAAPTARQHEVVAAVCREIRRRHLVTPALIVLEMSRPLNFMAAQTMHFFHPFLTALVRGDACEQFAAFLEKRGSVDYIRRQLEKSDPDDQQGLQNTVGPLHDREI